MLVPCEFRALTWNVHSALYMLPALDDHPQIDYRIGSYDVLFKRENHIILWYPNLLNKDPDSVDCDGPGYESLDRNSSIASKVTQDPIPHTSLANPHVEVWANRVWYVGRDAHRFKYVFRNWFVPTDSPFDGYGPDSTIVDVIKFEDVRGGQIIHVHEHEGEPWSPGIIKHRGYVTCTDFDEMERFFDEMERLRAEGTLNIVADGQLLDDTNIQAMKSPEGVLDVYREFPKDPPLYVREGRVLLKPEWEGTTLVHEGKEFFDIHRALGLPSREF